MERSFRRTAGIAGCVAALALSTACNDAAELTACANAVRQLAQEGSVDPTAPDFQAPAECEGVDRQEVRRIAEDLLGENL